MKRAVVYIACWAVLAAAVSASTHVVAAADNTGKGISLSVPDMMPKVETEDAGCNNVCSEQCEINMQTSCSKVPVTTQECAPVTVMTSEKKCHKTCSFTVPVQAPATTTQEVTTTVTTTSTVATAAAPAEQTTTAATAVAAAPAAVDDSTAGATMVISGSKIVAVNASAVDVNVTVTKSSGGRRLQATQVFPLIHFLSAAQKMHNAASSVTCGEPECVDIPVESSEVQCKDVTTEQEQCQQTPVKTCKQVCTCIPQKKVTVTLPHHG